jgi:hypothetical protein
VYDITANAGRVSLGITHDTAAFVEASIRTWLDKIGTARIGCRSCAGEVQEHR